MIISDRNRHITKVIGRYGKPYYGLYEWKGRRGEVGARWEGSEIPSSRMDVRVIKTILIWEHIINDEN